MLLNQAQAEELTARIKNNIHENARLIKQAVDGKIWLALGLSSFSDWLTETVGISRSRGYQLLNIARVEDQLKQAIQLPAGYILSDLSTRLILKHGTDSFIEQVSAMATDDALTNAGLVEKQLAELRGSVEEPTPIRDLDRHNDRTSLVYASAFLRSVQDLPEPNDLAPEDRAESLSKLQETLTELDNTLSEFRSIQKQVLTELLHG